jgi:hypothetical protein
MPDMMGATALATSSKNRLRESPIVIHISPANSSSNDPELSRYSM